MPLEFLFCNYPSAGPALKVFYICAGFLDTKLSEESNFEGGLTIKNTSGPHKILCNIMVTCIAFHVLVLFVGCKVSKLRFLRQKINVQRVLVIWLKFLQSSLLILISKSLKQGLLPFIACFLLMNKYFVCSHCATRAHEHFKLWAHFYPHMNIS